MFDFTSTHLILVIILFIVGIVCIVKGGDWFVDAASWIAEVTGIPKLIIGATIVSIATTLPELLVSVMAAARGSVDLSIGNAVGSVTANIGLILAISVLFMPSVIKRSDYLLKSILMLAAATLIVLCGFVGKVNIVISILLIIIWLIFMYQNIKDALISMKKDKALEPLNDNKEEVNTIEVEGPSKTKKDIIINILKFIVGAAGIVLGAELLVDTSKELALRLNISEGIIGVTIVAVGTSLPELITTITAIIKKESSLSVGNIIGANIMDLALIMPISSLIARKALPISDVAKYIDLPACLLVGCIALIPTLINKKFTKAQGIILLTTYILYLVIRVNAAAWFGIVITE